MAWTLNILMADGHPLSVLGMRNFLAAVPGLVLLGVANNMAQASEILARKKIDLIILELNFPSRPSVEALQSFKDRWPRVPVLVFTSCAESEFGLRALLAGADGYLSKTASQQEFIEAVRKVAGGYKHLSPHLAATLAAHLHASRSQTHRRRV